MTASRASLMRAATMAAALCSVAVPSSAQAACTLLDTVVALGRVAGVDQLKALQGQVVGGTLVRGTAAPVTLRLTGCSSSLSTTLRGDNVTMSIAGTTVTFAPWLISVNGSNLSTPKDLTQTTHTFTATLGSPTLGILLVPVTTPTTLTAGQYVGSGLLTFTDAS